MFLMQLTYESLCMRGEEEASRSHAIFKTVLIHHYKMSVFSKFSFPHLGTSTLKYRKGLFCIQNRIMWSHFYSVFYVYICMNVCVLFTCNVSNFETFFGILLGPKNLQVNLWAPNICVTVSLPTEKSKVSIQVLIFILH